MRVLVVADVVGGVRTFVGELTPGLAGRGIEVHLALLGPDVPDPLWAHAAASCQVRDLKLEWMDEPWGDVEATGQWIGELIAQIHPDVVHMNTFAPVPAAEVPVLLTVHSCVPTWWRAVRGAEAPASWARYRRLVQRSLARSAALTAPTRSLLDELRLVYGSLPTARVIPNGRAIKAPLERRDARLVVSVGRLWDEAKNAALVARAAPGIEGRVVLIGPGEVRGTESLGPLPAGEVARWLARAAVFAEPARYEPFGLAALEAALCGCALVLGDIPSLREVWHDAASYVAPDDPEALARSINALLGDPGRRRRAAHVAGARAAAYTPEAMAGAYLGAYRQVTRSAVAA